MRTFTRRLGVTILLLTLGACAPRSVLMVHPTTGARETCPPPVGTRTTTLTMDQFNRLQALHSEAERTRMTAVELCVRALAIEGFLRRYVHPRGDWSLSYPSDWTLDESDLAFIKIRPAPGLPEGLVGIHSFVSRSRSTSLDEYVDRALAFLHEDAVTRGQRFELLSRSQTRLSDGTPAVEVLNLLGTGVVDKSRKLYVLHEGRPLLIDAETYLTSWERLEPQFDQILNSFAVRSD